jgi:hypothetical protein
MLDKKFVYIAKWIDFNSDTAQWRCQPQKKKIFLFISL